MRDKPPSNVPVLLFIVLVVVYGAVQLAVGFMGMVHHLGAGWAWVCVASAFLLRFTLPLSIGAFLAAWNVWDWPWYGALVFTVPGLGFMILMIPRPWTS